MPKCELCGDTVKRRTNIHKLVQSLIDSGLTSDTVSIRDNAYKVRDLLKRTKVMACSNCAESVKGAEIAVFGTDLPDAPTFDPTFADDLPSVPTHVPRDFEEEEEEFGSDLPRPPKQDPRVDTQQVCSKCKSAVQYLKYNKRIASRRSLRRFLDSCRKCVENCHDDRTTCKKYIRIHNLVLKYFKKAL